ncbi:MAG: hypothetical protein JWM80_176 [Cyanobacteria bacterium RYN_339]|nr:hypothetical protein [Cyanobacteria bacterium RYN_339]
MTSAFALGPWRAASRACSSGYDGRLHGNRRRARGDAFPSGWRYDNLPWAGWPGQLLAGVDFSLLKPFDNDKVLETVQRALEPTP